MSNNFHDSIFTFFSRCYKTVENSNHYYVLPSDLWSIFSVCSLQALPYNGITDRYQWTGAVVNWSGMTWGQLGWCPDQRNRGLQKRCVSFGEECSSKYRPVDTRIAARAWYSPSWLQILRMTRRMCDLGKVFTQQHYWIT